MIGRASCSFLLALAGCSPQEGGGERQQTSATGDARPLPSHRKLPVEAYLQKEDRERAQRPPWRTPLLANEGRRRRDS